MKFQLRSFLQFLLFVAVMILLVRLFPVVARLGSAAALSVRHLWLILLVMGVGGWVIWMLRKDNQR